MEKPAEITKMLNASGKSVFKMNAHLKRRNGTDTLLCDSVVVLCITVFLHQ